VRHNQILVQVLARLAINTLLIFKKPNRAFTLEGATFHGATATFEVADDFLFFL
jgi:hypothetical protein